MTVLNDCRLALAALIAASVDTTVSAFPFGENEPAADSIHIATTDCRFEWRSIGSAATNRTEDITVEVVFRAYREGPSQTTAAADALNRVEDLLAAVETAIQADPAGPFTIGGTVTHARVSEWSVRPVPRESGWAAEGRARLTATNYP